MRLPQYECPICGKIWNRETGRLLEGKTCSKTCSSIKGYLSGDRKETGIELKLQEILLELGIAFETQKPLAGITVSDIFIYPNVAIFADGDYWHKDIKFKDDEKTKNLEKHHFIVLRLSETEINTDTAAVKLKILEAYSRRKANKNL